MPRSTCTARASGASIVCKGLVGKSGASIFAGNLVISGRVLGNTEEQARNTAEFLIKYHNQFLIDQNWARGCGQWIENVYYPELEEAGLYLRRDDEGNVVTSPGKIRSVAANMQGNSGVPFMDLRRKQVIKAGIPRLEETVVTALLRKSRRLGRRRVRAQHHHRRIPCGRSARAVILATGYSDRLHARSTGTREMSGDGIAMAWRVGATLVNLEMQWWHTNDIADPPSWQRMQVYPNPMLGSEKSARMVNSAGEEFFNQQQDDPLAFGPYTVQLKALAKQVHAGKARYDGGYYAGFDHCDARGGRCLHDATARASASSACAFPSSMVETAVTSHYRQGGIDVDTNTMRSSVPGLYVAGGLGGHSNGLIALATYDGKVVADGVAARSAGARARRVARSRTIAAGGAGLDALLASRRDGRRRSQGEGQDPRDDVGQGRRREGRGQPAGRRCEDIDRYPPRPAAAHERDREPARTGQLRMARRHRRRQHGRCLRADHPFVAGAQGKPRAVHAADFPMRTTRTGSPPMC